MEITRGVNSSSHRKLDSIQTNTLEALRTLGNPSDLQRVQAALNLLKRLSGKCYVHKDVNEQKNEVDYVLERLVRGVGASRDSARTGNFAALVSMLTVFTDIPVSDILELVKKELSKGKGVSKSEAADIHMGQVLVYGALIKSGRFNEASSEEKIEILNNLITAGKKRSYLTLVAYTFVMESLNLLKEKSFKKGIFPLIQESCGLKKDVKDLSLDEIYLLLGIRARFPSLGTGVESLLHPLNVPHCASVLMNIPNISYLKHPVYEEYCKKIASTEFVSVFWQEIEKQLSKQNRNRKLVALEMLKHLFRNLQDKSVFPSFVSPVFINLILKSKANKRQAFVDDDAHDIFTKVKEIFPALMSSILDEAVNDKIKVEVLRRLLFHPGNFMLEKNTGLRVVQPITTSLKSKGVKKLAKVYQDVVAGKLNVKEENCNEGRKPDFKVLPWKNKERIYAAQLLARLVGIPVMGDDHEWKFEQAKFLLHWGVFSKQLGHSGAEDMGVVGLELSHALRESFFRCLDHKSGGLSGSIKLLLKLVRHVDELLDDNEVEDKALKGKVLEDWKSAVQVISKLESQTELDECDETKPKGKVGEAKVFLLLFLQLALQLFDWDAKLAAESLAELSMCYNKLEQEKKQRKTSKEKSHSGSNINGECEEEEDPVWVEVVMDLFLHLLSQNRHLLRSMISSVFTHICPHLTPASIHSIVQVLVPQSGKNPLRDEESDGESDEQDGSDADSSDGEEEMSADDSEGGDDEPTVNETLRVAVQKALGTSAPASDTESLDVDEIGEEEGQQLDAALSDAFRLLKDSKGSGKAKKLQSKDEKSLTHFRVRVVDLLEIFLDSNPSMALCCDLILPLFECLEFCIKELHQKPLENRIRTCFKKFSSIKSFSSTDGVDDTLLSDLLKALVDKGSKTAPVFLEMGNEVMHCCTFVVRSSEYLKKENEKSIPKEEAKNKKKKSLVQNSEISDLFKSSLETFFTKRNCLLPVGMFRQALQQSWSGCWCLVPILIRYGFDTDVRPFRRNQALQLLTTFFLNQNLVLNQDPVHQDEFISIKKEISLLSKKVLEALVDTKESSKLGKKCLIALMGLLQAIKSSEGRKQIKMEPLEGQEEVAETLTESEGMDWDELGAILSSVYCGGMKAVGPEGKKAVGKVLKSLGLQNVIARHQKDKQQKVQEQPPSPEEEVVKVKDEVASEGSGDESEDVEPPSELREKQRKEKKKKRKKASKVESRKLKKEAKEFRMQEFSKGLEDSNFADVGEMPENGQDDNEVALNGSASLGSIGKLGTKRKSEVGAKKVKRIRTN